MTATLKQDILNYLKAGFPMLYVQTYEEERAEQEIKTAAKEITPERAVFVWSVTKGWLTADGKKQPQEVTDPYMSLMAMDKMPQDAVYVLRDFHPFIAEPQVLRRIRDLSYVLKATGRTMVFLSPTVNIPTELEKDITLLSLDLPSREQLSVILDAIVDSIGGAATAKINNRTALLEAARGLTTFEAEQTFALAAVKHGDLSERVLPTVQHEKAGAIKKTGIAEFFELREHVSIGGLNALKGWLNKRAKAFTDEAKAYGLDEPRGVLLVGVQGCGKSLSAKAVAQQWQLPLLRLDFGRVFGSLVGQSEENLRRVLALAEAVAPCVLWLDELEKGLSGLQSSGQTDSGVSARVFGTFLTWMNEKRMPVFVVATCNNIDALPAEMVRKGRFDEIFFVDLPTQTERGEIFEIHLRKRNRNPKDFDIAKLAMSADQFSGAEIEEAIKSAMFDAFETGSEITTEHVLHAIESTSPLAETAKDKVGAVRESAKRNKWRPATTVIETPHSGRRRISN